MKNKVFLVLVIAAVTVSSIACEVFSISVTVPTDTPQPTDTLQPTATVIVPTATEFVPKLTQIVPPTMAPIPEDCVSPETIQYQQSMEEIESRFTDIYKKTNQDAGNVDVMALSTDRENMNILLRDSKNLTPSTLFADYNNILLSEEQAYINFITYLLNGDTINSKAQLALQNQYNAQERAELTRIDIYCGVPLQSIPPGDIG